MATVPETHNYTHTLLENETQSNYQETGAAYTEAKAEKTSELDSSIVGHQVVFL